MRYVIMDYGRLKVRDWIVDNMTYPESLPESPPTMGVKGESPPEEALNEIYNCFEQFLRLGGLGPFGVNEDGTENSATNRILFWRNEFLFRCPCSEAGEAWAIRLVCDGSLFSEGIAQFREKTRIIFKHTHYGVMWKIIPLASFACTDVFDGCITQNHDCIEDVMDGINQPQHFGSFLDIIKETRAYILWIGRGEGEIPP
jgi:hypothetical protein